MKNKSPFKYYFIGTQIDITVLIAVFIGYQIDKFLNHKKYIITLAISAVFIFYTLYALIKDISQGK